jgi:hypothetical protein
MAGTSYLTVVEKLQVIYLTLLTGILKDTTELYI